MKSELSPIVSVPDVPKLEPQMSWIWADESNFPRERLGEPDLSNYEPKILAEFEDAILRARDRIWILDPYFDKRFGLPAIWLAFCASQAKSIRVISHEPRPDAWIGEAIKEFGYEPPAPVEWKVCFHSLHDRFALVDNELWHFGSTVGGAYPRFGAVTRGWATGHINRVFLSRWER